MHGWVLLLTVLGVIAWAATWYALGRLDGRFDAVDRIDGRFDKHDLQR